MADNAVEALGGKTPLEAAATTCMDYLAKHGCCGSLKTVPESFSPSSEVAILSILGYPASELPHGRGPLEARGLDLPIPDHYLAMRYLFKDTNTESKRKEAIDILKNFTHKPISETKGICLISENDFKSLRRIEGMEFWSADKYKSYISFSELHPSEKQSPTQIAIIGAVPLLKGIAMEIGAKWIKPEHSTGTPHTNFREKGEAAISLIPDFDYIIVHIEACDYASHAMDPATKVASIEAIDREIVAPILSYMEKTDEEIAIAVMSDHPSLCENGCHSADNSPFLYYYPGIKADTVKTFNEKSVKEGTLRKISDIYER